VKSTPRRASVDGFEKRHPHISLASVTNRELTSRLLTLRLRRFRLPRGKARQNKRLAGNHSAPGPKAADCAKPGFAAFALVDRFSNELAEQAAREDIADRRNFSHISSAFSIK
jgi:hypothetical protein